MAENKNTSSIEVLQLSNYVRPDVVENTSKDWVLNGKNNSFYQYIIDRQNGSPTNSSINNSYIDLIYGRGLGFKNGNVGVQDWAKLQGILKPRELRKIIADFQIFGEFSAQVIKTKGGKLSTIEHIAKESIVPNKQNEDGEIGTYWFSRNWSDTYRNKPEPFSAFGTSKDPIEIYCGKPYKIGKVYFSDPDYLAGMPYMEMEEEIANLNINFIKRGLTAGYIVHVPDGVNLTDEQKRILKKKIESQLTGSSNAGSFILNFAGRDQEPITVTVFPTNENIHKQWEFLTGESKKQIMASHRVINSSIVGLDSATGFSSQADLIDTAEKQMVKRVIKPKQDFVLEAIEEILLAYGISLNLYFKPLTEEVITPTELSNQVCSHTQLSDEESLKMFDVLNTYALDMSTDYDLTDGKEYDLQLSANQSSEQDSALWKIRYAYTKGTSKTPTGGSRLFCNKMLLLEATGKVFRKEDIELMSSQGVNGQFAHSGGKYDIFLYGGGVNCYHRWERRIFKKKLNTDGTPKKGGAMATTTEVNVNEAKRQGAKLPKNNPDVAKAEIDKPNNGRF